MYSIYALKLKLKFNVWLFYMSSLSACLYTCVCVCVCVSMYDIQALHDFGSEIPAIVLSVPLCILFIQSFLKDGKRLSLLNLESIMLSKNLVFIFKKYLPFTTKLLV